MLADSCKDCPGQQYSDEQGAVACKACPAGRFSQSGSEACSSTPTYLPPLLVAVGVAAAVAAAALIGGGFYYRSRRRHLLQDVEAAMAEGETRSDDGRAAMAEENSGAGEAPPSRSPSPLEAQSFGAPWGEMVAEEDRAEAADNAPGLPPR